MRRESTGRVLLGLATGTVFGFLLQKGRASKFESITGQLRFTDWSVIQIMATAAAVGAIGTQALSTAGVSQVKVKPLNTGGVLLGGTLFGAGMAILGYCPGTSMAAIGEGKRDAIVGAGGMLAGALAFVALYPHLKPVIEMGAMGKQTLPEMTDTSPWLWVAGLSTAVAAGAKLLEARAA
jgi:uncharacterized protein